MVCNNFDSWVYVGILFDQLHNEARKKKGKEETGSQGN